VGNKLKVFDCQSNSPVGLKTMVMNLKDGTKLEFDEDISKLEKLFF
jgi:hypothetical protein